jgi:hypothetical protein
LSIAEWKKHVKKVMRKRKNGYPGVHLGRPEDSSAGPLDV